MREGLIGARKLSIGGIATSLLEKSARRSKALNILHANMDITNEEFHEGKQSLRVVLESENVSPAQDKFELTGQELVDLIIDIMGTASDGKWRETTEKDKVPANPMDEGEPNPEQETSQA